MAVRRLPDEDLDEATEGWVGDRVSLFRWAGSYQGWHVEVGAMEVLRGGAEGDVRRAIATALRSVPGVEDVREEDREVWDVTGNPSGEEMARAVDAALEPFADAIRPEPVERMRYTASAKGGEFESDKAPMEMGNGFPRRLPEDAVVNVSGLRHASMRRATMCGIPNDEMVIINRDFAPDLPGACPACIAGAEEWERSARDRISNRNLDGPRTIDPEVMRIQQELMALLQSDQAERGPNKRLTRLMFDRSHVKLLLRPGEETLAQELQAKYGEKLQIQLGLTWRHPS